MDSINKNNKIYFRLFCYLAIAIGIVLRLAQYLSNKSLWRDEARIALNLIEKNFIGVTGSLNYDQTAPPGFMLFEKLFISVLGISEYALRLFPLLCGILSVFLFYKIIKKTLSAYSGNIALLLFSILTPLIYYSSELKQYSSDVLISEILLLWAIYLTETKFDTTRGIMTGLLGAIVIWVSYPSIFLLVGIGLFLLVRFVKDRKQHPLSFLCTYILWALSFYILYKTYIHKTTNNELFNSFWERWYMPSPIISISSLNWLSKAWSEFLNYLTLDPKIIFILIPGVIYLLFKDKYIFIIFFSPIFCTIVGSAIHKYPLSGRLLLFLVPSVIFFLGKGIELVKLKTFSVFPIITIILTVFILYPPLLRTKNSFLHPPSIEEIKPALRYIKDHLKQGDVIYLNNHLQFAFKYYAKDYDFFDDLNFVIPTNNDAMKNGLLYKNKKYTLFIDPYIQKKSETKREECLHLLDKVKGNKRVWVMYSTYVEKPACNLGLILNNTAGIKLLSFIQPGVNLYLYDLSEKNENTSN